MLEIKNLQVTVDGREILKGLDLTVNKGEVHAIMSYWRAPDRLYDDPDELAAWARAALAAAHRSAKGSKPKRKRKR